MSTRVLSAFAWCAVLLLFGFAAARSVSNRERENPLVGAEIVPSVAATLRDSVGATRKMRIQVFSDFACGSCRRLDSLVAAHPWVETEFEVSYRHNPIIGGEVSKRLAQFAHCTLGERSRARTRLPLYARASSSQRGTMDSVASSLPSDSARAELARCLVADSTRTRVAADEAAARELVLTSTPGILVDSMLFRGMPSDIIHRLDRLRRAR